MWTHVDGQLVLSLEHRGFAGQHNVLAAFEPVLDPSFPFAAHNWRYEWDMEEERLADVQNTYYCIPEEPGCAVVAGTGSFA